MYKLIIVLFLFAITEAGCKTTHYSASEPVSMNVYYIKGPFEPHLPLVCGQVSNYMGSELAMDTILTDTILLKKVRNFIQILDASTHNNETKNCDIRVQCELNFDNGTSRRMCIGDFNCIQLDGKNVGECDSLEYLIKVHSGYYNFFEGWRLNNFKEIKQYGVPDDYKLIIDK